MKSLTSILLLLAMACPAMATITRVPGDYDGDGKTDPGVYFAEQGRWYIARSQLGPTEFSWGWNQAQPVVGDFDGDGKSDSAVFVASEAKWYIYSSSNGATRIESFGTSAMIPCPADFDGDGKTDLALYDRKSGNWYIRYSIPQGDRVINFGFGEARPVPADYDGDGKADLAVFHRHSGNWYVFGSSNGFKVVNFGYRDARPVPGDYDGDGKADLAVFDRQTGNWIRFGTTDGYKVINWGFNRARPVPGDYDGDGKTDLAVFERATGTWFIWQSLTQSPRIFTYGWDQSTPLPTYRHPGLEGGVVLCFGDSITYGTSSACNCPDTGYPARLERLLGAALGGMFDVINAGVPGETTAGGNARFGGVFNADRPELLLLMQGTNDQFFEYPFGLTDGNLRSMISQARNGGASAILATIPPVISNQFRNRSAQAARIRAFNPNIYGIAASFGIPVAQIYEAITSVPGWESALMDQPTANHPNDAGYDVVTARFLQTVRQAVRNGQMY